MLFRLEAVLDNGLEYERLLYGGMVGAKSCLGGCVEVEGSSSGGESSVDSGHEHFREGRGDGDATIVLRVRSIVISPPLAKVFMATINARLTTTADSLHLHAPT